MLSASKEGSPYLWGTHFKLQMTNARHGDTVKEHTQTNLKLFLAELCKVAAVHLQ